MAKQNIFKRGLNKVEDKLQDGWESTKEKFEEAQDSTIGYIKKNPLKSVLISLGIGAVIGAAISLGIESAVRTRARNRSFWDKYL